MKPTVGRTVHYTNPILSEVPEIYAALITKVVPLEGDELHRRTLKEGERGKEFAHAVSLCVFHESGYFFMKDVPFTYHAAGYEGSRGKWTWPERES